MSNFGFAKLLKKIYKGQDKVFNKGVGNVGL